MEYASKKKLTRRDRFLAEIDAVTPWAIQLWRSIKYEEVYLKAYDSVSAAKAGLGNYIQFYNTRRPHQSFGGKTPDMIYFAGLPTKGLAA